mmetsp:Transcript_77449/g.250748  ORF Transcript_77449/g.250748 Transcript_77449/m.250748 type:complete len:92 (+) Transcript_77449:279-554(+)
MQANVGMGEDASPAPIAVPLGYRLVLDPERLETLAGLRRKVVDLDDQYTRLPLRIETEGARRQQESLRAKLKETENAVKLFSRSGGVLVEI